MTIFSISHSPRLLAAALVFSLSSAVLLPANRSQARAPAPAAAVSSRIIARWQIKPDSRPQWARFSPANPDLVLLDAGGEGLLLATTHSAIRHIDQTQSPVGWLGGTVVVRDQTGAFRLLEPAGLSPSGQFSLGSVPLPQALGKNRRLQFDVALPNTAKAGIRPSHGKETGTGLVNAREDQAGFEVGAGPLGQTVVDAGGKVMFRGAKTIYGITPSPDTYKIIVYYGNTDYVLFNRLTRTTTPLPSSIHAWWWMPDNSTLLGEVSLGGEPGREQVTGTELYLRQTARTELVRLTLPPEIRGAALRILDISSEGKILIEAERVKAAPAYLGLAVLEIVWP